MCTASKEGTTPTQQRTLKLVQLRDVCRAALAQLLQESCHNHCQPLSWTKCSQFRCPSCSNSCSETPRSPGRCMPGGTMSASNSGTGTARVCPSVFAHHLSSAQWGSISEMLTCDIMDVPDPFARARQNRLCQVQASVWCVRSAT